VNQPSRATDCGGFHTRTVLFRNASVGSTSSVFIEVDIASNCSGSEAAKQWL
jgi:hypothetical protein